MNRNGNDTEQNTLEKQEKEARRRERICRILKKESITDEEYEAAVENIRQLASIVIDFYINKQNQRL